MLATFGAFVNVKTTTSISNPMPIVPITLFVLVYVSPTIAIRAHCLKVSVESVFPCVIPLQSVFVDSQIPATIALAHFALFSIGKPRGFFLPVQEILIHFLFPFAEFNPVNFDGKDCFPIHCPIGVLLHIVDNHKLF